MGMLEQTLRWVTAVGVPLLITILVPFGFAMSHDIGEIRGELLRINANLVQLEQRADRTDAANGERFGRLDAALQTTLARMDQQFERVDQRFERMDQQFERVDQRFERVDQQFERVDQQFERVGQRFEEQRTWTEARIGESERRLGDRILEVETRLGERIGGIEAAGAARDARLDEFGIQLARTNERLGAIDEVVRENRALLQRRGKQIDEIARGLERTETDPAIVLSRIGVPIDADVAAFWIGGRVVSVPRTEEAQRALVEAGFERVAVSPAIIGYVAPTTGATRRSVDP